MSEFMWIVLEVNPEPWAIGPVSVGRKAGKIFPIVGRNTQLHSYKEAIKEAIESFPVKPDMIEGKITLRFFFWRNRADYVTPQARTHRKHEVDVTNLQKATEDALQGVLFENDKDVDDIHSRMVEQGPEVVGRIVIGIKKSSESASKAYDKYMLLTEMPHSVYVEVMAIDERAKTPYVTSRIPSWGNDPEETLF